MAQPTWGDTVKIKSNADALLRPGALASVCGMRTIDNADAAKKLGYTIGTVLLLVEFGDGTSIEIPASLVDVDLPADGH